jgi:hypothetical protein
LVYLPQVRQEGFGAIHDAPEVDIHDPVEIYVGDSLGLVDECYTCIIDDEMDGAVLLKYIGGKRLDGFALSDINRVRAANSSRGRNLLASLLQACFIDVRKRQDAAAPGQMQCECFSNAGSGASNYRDVS